MIMKNFGKSDYPVSILGFGCWGIGKSEWIGANDNESKKIFLKAIEEGINFFDTALAYGEGHSENILGDAVKESGREVFIATKIPSKKREGRSGGCARNFWAIRAGRSGRGSSPRPESRRAACRRGHNRASGS